MRDNLDIAMAATLVLAFAVALSLICLCCTPPPMQPDATLDEARRTLQVLEAYAHAERVCSGCAERLDVETVQDVLEPDPCLYECIAASQDAAELAKQLGAE